MVQLIRRAQAIVVIGGKHSANTQLAKLASSHNRPTFHVETAEDLIPEAFREFDTVGVTAGASTPELFAVCVNWRLLIREFKYGEFTQCISRSLRIGGNEKPLVASGKIVMGANSGLRLCGPSVSLESKSRKARLPIRKLS